MDCCCCCWNPVSVNRSSLSLLSLCLRSALFSVCSDRIDKVEKDLTEQQKHHRDEIGKIQETAKQVQQAAVAKQTQAQQLMQGQGQE